MPKPHFIQVSSTTAVNANSITMVEVDARAERINVYTDSFEGNTKYSHHNDPAAVVGVKGPEAQALAKSIMEQAGRSGAVFHEATNGTWVNLAQVDMIKAEREMLSFHGGPLQEALVRVKYPTPEAAAQKQAELIAAFAAPTPAPINVGSYRKGREEPKADLGDYGQPFNRP